LRHFLHMAYRPAKKIHLSQKHGILGEAFTRFEGDKRIKKVSHRTIELYEYAWKFFAAHLEPFGQMTGDEDTDFESPTRKQWEKRIVTRINAAILERDESDDPVSPVTVNTYLRVINTFLKWLKDEDESLKFKWKVASLEVPTGQRREIFTDEEVSKLLKFKPKSFNQTRAWTIAMVMLDCGIRIEEALTLTIQDIDWDGDLLTIIGKGNKLRRVPIAASKSILHRFVSKHMPQTAKYIFGTRTGKIMSQRNSLRDIGVVQRKSGVRDLSWHCYRHTFATGYLRRGGRIDKLQRILGHADIKTTMVYLHMEPSYVTEDHENFSSLTPMI
jgi:integrase/recombinase XerD